MASRFIQPDLAGQSAYVITGQERKHGSCFAHGVTSSGESMSFERTYAHEMPCLQIRNPQPTKPRRKSEMGAIVEKRKVQGDVPQEEKGD